MASALNITNIKKELLNELRNSDIIDITTRGVTTTTDNFTGDGSTTIFTLTNPGVKNIRSITIDGNPNKFYTDYNYNESISGGSMVMDIEFKNAPGSGSTIIIEYDYSSVGDRIYPDFPKETVSVNKFPRIGFDITSINSEEISLGGTHIQSNILITIACYGVGTKNTDLLINELRSFMINKKDSFQTLNFITFDSLNPMIVVKGTNDKIFERSIDFICPFEFEF